MSEESRNKYNYIVALLAALFALITFQGDLKATLHFGPLSVEWLVLAWVMIGLIGLSVYVAALSYSLDFLSRSKFAWLSEFSQRMGNWLLAAADNLYFVGMTFPLQVGFAWAISWAAEHLTPGAFQNVVGLIAAVVSVTASFVIGYAYSRERKESRQLAIQKALQTLNARTLDNAEELIKQGAYNSGIIEAVKVLEIRLKELLLTKRGYETDTVSVRKLVAMARQEGLLTKKQAAEIIKVRNIRAVAAQLSGEVDHADAEQLLERVKQLLAGPLRQD
jgi:HEPN domain-containing protein